MTGGQVCAAIATLALLAGGSAGLASRRLTDLQIKWLWFGGASLGIGASLLGVLWMGIVAESEASFAIRGVLGGAPGRAMLLACIVAVSSLVPILQTCVRERRWKIGGAELFPAAVMAGLSVLLQPSLDEGERWGSVAGLLLSGILVTTGLMLFSAGRILDEWIWQGAQRGRAFVVAFVGLTVTVLALLGTNWRVWGTPFGSVQPPRGTMSVGLALLAAWLVGTTYLVLRHRLARGGGILVLLNAVLLVLITLSAHWHLPFD